MKRLAAALALGCLIVLAGMPVSVLKAEDLDSSDFNAGNIVSDSNFFDGDAMSVEQIQQFLDAKVPVCDTDGSESHTYRFDSTTREVNQSGDPYVTTTRAVYGERIYQDDENYGPTFESRAPYICLKSKKFSIPERGPEESLCSGFEASTNRSAAYLINTVAESCGVSEKVLLVLLQKEQSLVTDTWPWGISYRKATGFACPDTAPCDNEFAGFFGQVYYAARQFKYYAKYPDTFNHIPGETNFVRYNPNSSCGGSNVFIKNQATAGLYNYTPYQPNKGSLAHKLEGGRYYETSSPDCGAYGNINFWLLWRNWFGSTTKESLPIQPIKGDWSSGAADEIGFKRGNYYHYDFNNDGIADKIFGIGRVTDIVIVGDWDGDGKDEIGLRRENKYYFDNNNDGTADVSFVYGKASDQVFVGDWDGNGSDSLGVKRGNIYYLANQNDGKADIKIGIGRVTDRVMVGDWDGNGTDNIGLKRGNDYYLDTNNDNKANIYFGLGRDSDRAFVGDWDGNGSDDIGLRRDNYYYLNTDLDNDADIYIGLGRVTDGMMIGDFNGDGQSELMLRRYNRYFIDNDLDSAVEASFILNYF
jgi:hypothetical protein